MSDYRIAMIDSATADLQTYIWNGSWASLGNPKNIPGVSVTAITLLWKNRIALTDYALKNIRALSFDNTDWNQIGLTSIDFADIGYPSLASVYPNRIGLIGDILQKLIEYDFNEQYFSIVGDQSTQSGISNPAICGMDYNKIAYIEETSHDLYMYEKIGAVWTAIGTPLNIPNGTNISITAMSKTRIAYIDDTNNKLRCYDWNETTETWSLLATGLTIVNTNPCIEAIASNMVAEFDTTNLELRTYTLSGTTWTLETGELSIPGASSYPAMTAFYRPFSINCVNEFPLDGQAIWPMSDY